MFIKIGSKLINVSHIRSIDNPMADDVKHEIEIVTDESAWHILEYSPDYPEVLKAYEFLCKGAHRFDDSNLSTVEQPEFTDEEIRQAMRDTYDSESGYCHSAYYAEKPYNKWLKDNVNHELTPDDLEANRKDAILHVAKERDYLVAVGGDSNGYDFIATDYRITEMGQAFLDNATRANNTIIVLNTAEELLLRVVARKPRDNRHGEANEHTVKGLVEYGFIYEAHHDGHLYILKAGEQWLAEHDKSPTETKADTKTGYRGVHNDGYSYIYRDDQVLFIGFLSENAVVELLDTETAALREQLSLADTRMGEMLRYKSFYEKSQPALSAAHDYIKEHKLALGGEDVAMLVLEDAQSLRKQLAVIHDELDKAQSDSSRWKQNYYSARENNSDLQSELEASRKQDRELQIRNAQLVALLNRAKTHLPDTESNPDLHTAIEAALSPVDDLPF